MHEIDAFEDEFAEPEPGLLLKATLPSDLNGTRLDRALAVAFPDLSRSRLQDLIFLGKVTLDGQPAASGSAKVKAGQTAQVVVPPPAPALPQPQKLELVVLYEDAHLIVIDKPAGMAAHPAPGTPDGTLVNALLYHCGDSLSGIGGVARPGIVHRLDKDTSGVMVAAKTDAAHQGLSGYFAQHDIDRAYIALTRGGLEPRSGTIRTQIGRSPHDRKKMAVVRSGGRDAVTHYLVEKAFGGAKVLAARVRVTLETGRTHQIRVHLASKGAPCLGDPVYGGGGLAARLAEVLAQSNLHRQALHAAHLGFRHPISGEVLQFETSAPEDMRRLEAELATL